MIILKRGKKNPRKFICRNCECEFVADTDEYYRIDKCGIFWYECDCPDCTYTAEASEPWEENDE